MVPCSKVAEALVDAGHRVTFITAGNSKGKLMCPKLFDHTKVKYILHEGIPELEEEYAMG